MQCPAARLLENLFAATEAIGNNDIFGRSRAHSRKQDSFSALDADIVMFLFVSESASHSTATRIEDRAIQAGFCKNRCFVIKVQQRFVMAMPMHDGPAGNVGRRIVRFMVKELSKRYDLRTQAFAVLVTGQKVRKLVSKDRDATRLEANNRSTLLNCRSQGVERIIQGLPSAFK